MIKKIAMVIFFLIQCMNGISLVYNLKIRRAFDLPSNLFEKTKRHHLWIASAVPIIFQRTRHIVVPALQKDFQDSRVIEGSLLNLRYKPSKEWWFELTTGLEKERVCTSGTTNIVTSRGGFDDFVFSGGYIVFPKEHSQMVFYGLFGVPSRWKIGSQETLLGDTLVGTRFFSAGGGLEYSYGFIEKLEESFAGIFQARCIHFFSRTTNQAIICNNNAIQPGNLIDILFLAQYRKKLTLFEAGYNPTFFTNQAIISNDIKTKSPNFVRQGFTISCTHLFKGMLFGKAPLALGTGINISRSKMFDTRIIAAWLNITTIF